MCLNFYRGRSLLFRRICFHHARSWCLFLARSTPKRISQSNSLLWEFKLLWSNLVQSPLVRRSSHTQRSSSTKSPKVKSVPFAFPQRNTIVHTRKNGMTDEKHGKLIWVLDWKGICKAKNISTQLWVQHGSSRQSMWPYARRWEKSFMFGVVIPPF